MSKSYLNISDNNFKNELKIGYLVGGSNFTQLTYDVATILCKTINDFCLIKKMSPKHSLYTICKTKRECFYKSN